MPKRKAPDPSTVPLTAEKVTEVKNCIEQCMMRYMTKRKAQATLQDVNIDPFLTDIVWNLLEHSNKDFFVRYYQKLKAIQLVEDFNCLLAKHITATQRYGLINGQNYNLQKPSNGLMEKNKALMVMPEPYTRHIGSSSNPCMIQTPIGLSSHGSSDNHGNFGSSVNPQIQAHIGSSSQGNNITHDFNRASLNGIVHPSNVEMMHLLYNNSHPDGSLNGDQMNTIVHTSNAGMQYDLYNNSHPDDSSRRASLDVVGPMNEVIPQSNVDQSTGYSSLTGGYCPYVINPHYNSTPQSDMGYNTQSTVVQHNGSIYAREPEVFNYGLPQDFYDPTPMHVNGNQGYTANSSWQEEWQQQSRHNGHSQQF